MSKLIINNFEELETRVGQELGVSEYMTITQEQINKFAEATGDNQWIHNDPERCEAESPYKVPIAHGYLTVSLAPYFLNSMLDFPNLKMGVNYGIENLRLMNPVKVNGRLRARAELLAVKNLKGTARSRIKITFEIEGESKPACVGEVIYLYQFAESLV